MPPQTTQTAVNTALVARRATYDTVVHFDDDETMLVITKELWKDLGKPMTLRIVLTEEDGG